MFQNRIKSLREKKGLTQKQLADIVDTSQQQIQRIESGVQVTRLDLATKICAALDSKFEVVFPSTRKTLGGARKNNLWPAGKAPAKELVESMEKAGIDMDPEVWTFKIWMRGRDPEDFRISGIEQKRICSILINEKMGFVLFDSEGERIAISTQCLQAWQFLWDAPYAQLMEPDEHKYFEILFTGRIKPVGFDIDADSEELDGSEDLERSNQLQTLLADLEAFGLDNDFVSFIDIDGEEVFIRPSEIDLLRMPLWAVEPKLESSDDDLMDSEPLKVSSTAKDSK